MSFAPSPVEPASSVVQQRDRWELKRACIGRELVQTEQGYCQQLELVTTYFVEILKAKGTLRQDIRESIFSSIKSIHSVNQTLLPYLEDGLFGLGFERFCAHLEYYCTYIDNIQNASKVLLVQVKKNKAFRRLKKLQESRPEFNNLKLEDLLPLPLQRIQQACRLFLLATRRAVTRAVADTRQGISRSDYPRFRTFPPVTRLSQRALDCSSGVRAKMAGLLDCPRIPSSPPDTGT